MADETPEESGTQTAPQPPSTPSGPIADSVWQVYFPTGVHRDKTAIRLASFPPIIYFWPTMVIFLICGVLQFAGGGDSEPSSALGWWATGALAFNLLVIVTDLDQKKFVITLLLVFVVGLGAWITTLKDMAVVSNVYDWLRSLDVHYSTHVYFLLSGMLWLFFFFGMIHPRFNYWRFEPNEFVHYILPLGRDQSIPRVGSTVTREVPDVLELLLSFGGGTLLIEREGQEVARIPHVPFLGRRMISIERMLGITQVKTIGPSH